MRTPEGIGAPGCGVAIPGRLAVAAATGLITTVAGTGSRGDGPDGMEPLKCQLARPHGILATREGVVYIDDSENHRLRRLTE